MTTSTTTKVVMMMMRRRRALARGSRTMLTWSFDENWIGPELGRTTFSRNFLHFLRNILLSPTFSVLFVSFFIFSFFIHDKSLSLSQSLRRKKREEEIQFRTVPYSKTFMYVCIQKNNNKAKSESESRWKGKNLERRLELAIHILSNQRNRFLWTRCNSAFKR